MEVDCNSVHVNDKKNDTNECLVKDFSQFVPQRVVSEDLRKKTICVEGIVRDDGKKALIFLEQTPFTEETLNDFFSIDSLLKTESKNDLYGKYECTPVEKFRGVKTTVIHPASEEDVKKYESHPIRICVETPEFYNSVILPHVLTQLSLNWVYDILDKKSEKKILCEDSDSITGFAVVPHSSWVDDDITQLHVVAIVRQKGVKSLRDLTESHLSLLRNVDAGVYKFLEDTYGIYKSRVVAFIHYHPSYYHLHIHFANISCHDLDHKTEKSHLLSEVINNIELMPEYYQKAKLSFIFNPLDSWICEKVLI